MRLTGTCSRCGLCCTARSRDGVEMRCHNLEIDTYLGVAGATTCKVYDSRYPGMPILMRRMDNGEVEQIAACAHGSSVDSEIIAKWIGRGCSLTIVEGAGSAGK